MNNLKFKVYSAETLKKPKSEFLSNSGVYFWVFGDQIIYVGTTVKSFKSRIEEHEKLFREGNRTIWFPSKNETVYDLIKAIPIDSIDNEFYKSKVYIPNNKSRWYPDKDLRDQEHFKDLVESINVEEYLKSLDLYLIPIKEITNTSYKNFIECIESFIQMSLFMEFELFKLYDGKNISYEQLTKDKKFGVLGKQEKSAEDIVNTFNGYENIILEGLPPNLYKETISLLSEGDKNGLLKIKELVH